VHMHVVFGLADAMSETARWAGGPLVPSRHGRPCPEVNKIPGQGAATSHLFIKLYTKGAMARPGKSAPGRSFPERKV